MLQEVLRDRDDFFSLPPAPSCACHRIHLMRRNIKHFCTFLQHFFLSFFLLFLSFFPFRDASRSKKKSVLDPSALSISFPVKGWLASVGWVGDGWGRGRPAAHALVVVIVNQDNAKDNKYGENVKRSREQPELNSLSQPPGWMGYFFFLLSCRDSSLGP